MTFKICRWVIKKETERKCATVYCLIFGSLLIYAFTHYFKIDVTTYGPGLQNVTKGYLQTLIGIPDRRVKEKYTLAEFKERVKTDKELLVKVIEQEYLLPESNVVIAKYLLGLPYTFNYDPDLKEHLQQDYDIMNDVMIFLHIQKSGGTHFNRKVKAQLEKPIKCVPMSPCPKQKCECLNPNNHMWMYTRAYSGFKCGVHADWTVLHNCIPNLIDNIEKKKRRRRYFYFTQLRDAVERYLSEYNFQINHNNWQMARLGCGNLRNAKGIHVKRCFEGPRWIGVTLDKFMACNDNLAPHRTTRMLADLSLADCYKNFTDHATMKRRAPIWLESAKRNLQTMEYFGLMEDEIGSDELFKKTFGLSFKPSIEDSNSNSKSEGGAFIKLTDTQFLKVLQLSELDIHLYSFGRGLFYQRLHEIN